MTDTKEMEENWNSADFERPAGEEKKRLLKQLWRDTFGDNYEYIDLIFENLYNSETSQILTKRYQENGEIRVVAGLVCIDYYLRKGDQQIKGAYICGVATKPEFRKQGIMKKLLEHTHEELLEKGYSFAFLIPADDKLRQYYNRLGYANMGMEKRLVISSEEDLDVVKKGIVQFESEINLNKKSEEKLKISGIHITNSSDLGSTSKKEIINNFASYLNNYEKSVTYPIIAHSKKQRETAIEEWLMSGGEIIYYEDIDSLNFIRTIEDCKLEILVLSMTPLGTLKSISRIKNLKRGDACIFVVDDKINFDHFADLDLSRKYGMIAYLDNNENLKYFDDCASDLKYSILAKDDFSENLEANDESIILNVMNGLSPRMFLMMD